MNFRRLYSREGSKSKGVLYDQTIGLNNYYAARDYPEKIRRIKFLDMETGKKFVFLTNNVHLKATGVAPLYKHRWKIELFFKWIKQHLKIKSLLGTKREWSENPSMDCGLCLRFGCYCKEEIYAQAKPLRNSTDSKHIHFR